MKRFRMVASDVLDIAMLGSIYALLYVASYVDAGFRLFTGRGRRW